MVGSRQVIGTWGLVLADVTALVALRPDPGTLAHDVAAPHAWVAAVGADEAAGTLARAGLWCAALWLGLGLLAAAAIRLPGALGRLARSASRVLLPAAIYRTVAGAAGLGVLLAPVAAGACDVPTLHAGAGPSSAPSARSAPSAPSAPSSALPAPTWPSDPQRSAPTLPAPSVPTSSGRRSSAPDSTPPAPNRSSPPVAQHPPRVQAEVVVRAGDSLWRISADRLGRRATAAEVATAWPRWYAANRTVIGGDPNLIRPGEQLHAPVPVPAQP